MPSLEEQANLEGVNPDEAMQAGLLYSRMLKNPATRAQALALMKQANPGMHIPEVDIPASLEAHFKPLRDKLEKLEADNAELKLSKSREALLQDLIDKGLAGNMSEAREIEKVALEKKIASYETAAEFVKMSKTQATPTPDFTIMGGPLEMPADFKDIAKNPKSWAQNAAVHVLNDIRAGKLKTA